MAKFEDVIQTLIETNNKLIKGEIELKLAQQISYSTQILINAARLQLDIYKATQKEQKFIEQTTTIEELKMLSIDASNLNKDDEEDITDKRPFDFDSAVF